MKYYLVNAQTAGNLGVKGYRYGNDKEGYVVNGSDIAIMTPQEIADSGAEEISQVEARTMAESFRNGKSLSRKEILRKLLDKNK